MCVQSGTDFSKSQEIKKEFQHSHLAVESSLEKPFVGSILSFFLVLLPCLWRGSAVGMSKDQITSFACLKNFYFQNDFLFVSLIL